MREGVSRVALLREAVECPLPEKPYARAMMRGDRALSAGVAEALTYWPGVVHAEPPVPADLSVLPPLFDELLGELPWWNRAWRVAEVGPAYPNAVRQSKPAGVAQFIEVTVPGLVEGDAAERLPFSARVRFADDRLLRWQAKVGAAVIGPGLAPEGEPEPYPFGPVFRGLMEVRGLSVMQAARRSLRAASSINRLRVGNLIPHPALVADVARALDMPVEDLAVIAGLDPADLGRA